MKVFGIGLSRTGTYSLFEALNTLGYHSAHNPGDMYYLKNDKLAYNPLVTDQYDALTDLPVARFYKELYQRYPLSKFILTIRDMDEWLESCELLFKRNANFTCSSPKVSQLHLDVYHSAEFNKNKFIDAYNRHIEDVLKFFRNQQDNLLMFNLCNGEGWEKLCDFLEKDIPDEPFPHLHQFITAGKFEKEFEQGKELISAGLYKEALDLYDDVLKLDNNLVILHEKAFALYKMGELNQAAYILESILMQRKTYYRAFINLVIVYCELKKYEEAFLLYNNYKHTLKYMKKWDRALILRLIRNIPSFHKQYLDHKNQKRMQYGLELTKQKKFNEALDVFNIILSESPDSFVAQNEKGVILTELGLTEEAINIFESLLNQDINYPIAVFNLIYVYFISNRFKEAQEKINIYRYSFRHLNPDQLSFLNKVETKINRDGVQNIFRARAD